MVSVAMILEKAKENPDEWREKVKQKGCSLATGVAWLAKSVSFVSMFLYALQNVPVERRIRKKNPKLPAKLSVKFVPRSK